MKQPRRANAVAYALYANAVVLLGILIVLLCGGRTSLMPAAMAEPPMQQPIAGGSGIFVMPAQFHPNVYGCYLMDVDHQTLCTYEYQAGNRALVLTSARNFRYDLQLKNFNTFPYWYNVKKMIDEESQADRVNESKQPAIAPETPKEQP